MTGMRRRKFSRMDSFDSQESPKSPVKTWPIQVTYCTWTGLSSPKCASSSAI